MCEKIRSLRADGKKYLAQAMGLSYSTLMGKVNGFSPFKESQRVAARQYIEKAAKCGQVGIRCT